MIIEFSRPFKIDSLSAKGCTETISADPTECLALAKRFGILEVKSVSATFKLKPLSHGDLIRVRGTVTAQVTQACVVTLEPVAQTVEEDIDLSFSPSVRPDRETEGLELDIDLTEDDPPEPIYDGIINLGELAAQFLALGLDPFPRLEDAVFNLETSDCADDEIKPKSPFAVLGHLKEKKSS